jgi:hypothetical protein
MVLCIQLIAPSMYYLNVLCQGGFLSGAVITTIALKPLTFMYPENMPLRISISFSFQFTWVADDLILV